MRWRLPRFRNVVAAGICVLIFAFALSLYIRHHRNTQFLHDVERIGGKAELGAPPWLERIRLRYEPYRELGPLPPDQLDFCFGDVVKLELDCRFAEDEWLHDLSQFSRITSIKLINPRSDPEGSRFLESMPRLEHVHFATYGPRPGTNMDEMLGYLRNANELKTLYLKFGTLQGSGLHNLQHWPNLEILDLSHSQVQDAGLVSLSHSSHLIQLFLQETKITDAGMVSMKALVNLDILNLDHTLVTDHGLEQLDGLPNLRILYLRHTAIKGSGLDKIRPLPNLVLLLLDNSPITDEGLKGVSKHTNLRRLVLARSKITDAGLKHLSSLTSLEQLDLWGTAVTAAGVAELQKKLPGLTQVSYGPNPWSVYDHYP